MSIIKSLNFKGKWRSYQQRILDNLNSYLNDKKLNIVAAPGAGKTTLGIEVIRRFGNNALILSPTIPIKNQWKTRIVEDFLSDNNDLDNLISTDIKEIKDITTTTYQRLQAVFRKGLEEELIKQLEERHIRTLVLDEAHHLRDEWYRTLKDLIEIISKEKSDFKIISLTATPPYDVSEKEWNNYYELCGEIDEEISVPELVKTGDLCPHQDLLYFSNLDETEKKVVYDFSSKRDKFFEYIKTTEFIRTIEKSPLLTDMNQEGDNFYLDMDFAVGLASYLFSINPTHEKANNILDYLKISKTNIPKFDFEIAENFINGLIGRFKEYFENSELVKNKLKELTLLKNASKVDFYGNDKYKKVFARSKNKINSILKITELEYSILQSNLREVILLDYIGEKSSSGGMNIISTFNALQSLKNLETKCLKYNEELNTYNLNKSSSIKIAILSGSLCVIPKSTKRIFEMLIKNNNIKTGNILFTDYDEEYLRVEAYGDTDLVKLITQLFEIGEINVLLGTHALLGEGWDSPCINTLILGSVVESFMLSNQMRGRALRVDKNDSTKTADIWHLLAVENDINNSYDYQKISKRFETFDGINYQYDIIENGIERLGKAFSNINVADIEKLNIISKKWAKDRNNLFDKWAECLNKNKSKTKLIKQKRMYEGVKINGEENTYVLFKKIFKDKLGLCNLWNSPVVFYFGEDQISIPLNFIILFTAPFVLSFNLIVVYLFSLFVYIFLILFVFNNNKIVKSYTLFVVINQLFTIKNTSWLISNTLLKTLCHNKNIHVPINMLYLSTINEYYKVFVVNGGSKALKDRFNTQLLEMFNQPKEIHFIVKLKDQNDRVIFLPSAITELRDAEFFAKELSKYLGETEVIDTTVEYDKRELIRAKYNNFITSKAQKRRRFE